LAESYEPSGGAGLAQYPDGLSGSTGAETAARKSAAMVNYVE
jgi:hypothetical protein